MKKTRFGSQVSRETVNRWVVEYTGAALNFVKSVPVPTARQWLAMDVWDGAYEMLVARLNAQGLDAPVTLQREPDLN